jgi:hypothetical protein
MEGRIPNEHKRNRNDRLVTMDENELNKLYTALIDKGYSSDDLGDPDTFRKRMENKENRKILYDFVDSRGDFRIGDYAAYERRLMGKTKPVSAPEHVEGLLPGMRQGAEGLVAGIQSAAGETANLFTGSRRDYAAAQRALAHLQAGGIDLRNPDEEEALNTYITMRHDPALMDMDTRKEAREDSKDPATWWNRVGQHSSKGKLKKVSDQSLPGELQDRRAVHHAVEALRQSGGDVRKAYQMLGELLEKETWGDRQSREAQETLARQKPTKGFAAWAGQLVPQMAGTALAVAASTNPYTASLARPLAAANLAALTASSGGQSMAEARLYGDVDEGKVWSTGALNALIEGGTEQIPLVRYLDGMGATARRALGKSVADAAVSNGAARRELGKLLELGRRELGGKFLTRTTAEEYLKDVTAEGGSEFLAEGLQTLVPLIYQRPEDYPTLREVVENGLEGFKGGAFMGAFLGAGSRTVGHFAQQRRRKQQGTVYLAKRADGSVVEIIGHEGDMVTALAPGGEVMRFPYAEIKDHAEVSYEEFSRGLAGQVEREAEAEAAKARAASNPDTGEYVRVTLKDGTQANVVSGIPEAGGTLVVEDDAGNRRQVPVEGLVPESVQAVPAEEMAARAAESVRQAARDAEEASQLEARPGDEFTMPDGKRYRIEQDLRAQGGGYLSVPLDAEGNADYTSGETLQSTPEEMAYYLLAERRSAGQKAQGNGNNGGQNIPENGNIGQENIPAPTTVTGQPVQTEAVHLNNEATTTQVADTQQRQPTEITKQLSALERIPKDEKGEPVYEQADADTAWDAIVEQSEGDEATAKAVADSMVADKEAELKKVEKAKPRGGTTVAEKIAAERERKNAVEQAKATLAHWQRIAQTAERRRQAAMAEQANAAAEAARTQREQEEAERIEREEAERVRREALNGVPDLADDTPRDARARGYRRVSGEKIDRQQPLPAKQGKAVQVKFDDRNIPAGRVSLIEAQQLQPSHLNGRRNPFHFIDEAQPKERNDEASVLSARKIASNIRPEEITTSVTAYTGAPTVNARGEVVQGNNRSAALREIWAGHPEQAAKYKQYLADHAADFGLTPEDVESMQHPVLVNMLDVSDEDAIRLGQFVAQDTESGGVERIKPRNIVQKMGGDMRSYANQLLKSTDDEASFAELVDRNGIGTLKWMRTKGYITPTQYKSAFDSRGNLTAEAKNDLKGIMFQSIFQNGNTHLEEMFNLLPPKAQKAILATAYRDYDSPNSERMNMELQDSISAYYALSQMPEFANAKNYKEARIAAEAWKRQLALDDVTGESYLPSERYSNFAILLATMYKGQTQMFIQNTFKNIYDLVQGTQEETLFETPDNTPRTLVEAINETLSGLSDELLLNGNFIYDGQRRNNVLAGSSAAGQEGRQGGTRSPETGGRTENGNESADRADRVTDGTGNSRNERNGGENQEGEEKEKSAQERLTKEEAAEIIADMEEHAEVAPEMALTIENWDAEFGEEGIVNTPLGEVKMGENQFTKMMRKGRNSKLGMIKPTLETPDIIVEDSREVKDDGTSERETSYVFVKAFIKNDGSRYYYFTSITVSKDGREVVVSNQEKSRNRVLRLILEGNVIWRTPKDATTSSAEKQDLDYAHPKEAEDATKGSGITPQSISSESKDSKKSPIINGLGEKIAEEEKKVDTNPTEAQKEAGNYKKGHVRIGQFDVSIEQPKGSVRSGVDASGNKWETTMQNTYGYIRGTEGVDGDHIDVFLSDNPETGNVYVVDQVNPETGEFDEHKVMYGFNSAEEAREAYLSNYSEGWQGLGNITEVSKDEFKKWINSSHRKTKPFAEYKSVKKAEEQTPVRKEGESVMDYAERINERLVRRKEKEDNVQNGSNQTTEARKLPDMLKEAYRNEDAAAIAEAALRAYIESQSDMKPVAITYFQGKDNMRKYKDVHSPDYRMSKFIADVCKDALIKAGVAPEALMGEKKRVEFASTTNDVRTLDVMSMDPSYDVLRTVIRNPHTSDSVLKEFTKRFQNNGLDYEAQQVLDERHSNGDILFREADDAYTVEERGIIDAAKENGTYMKAPNGKPTNLTERQWVQVRTKAFKEWFGDWEKAARIEKLRQAVPIKATGEEYKGKYDLNSKSAENYITKSLRGEYMNKDTGNMVKITRASRKVAHHDAENDIHLKSIAYIPQMIENAVFIEERTNEKGSKFDSYRYYVVGLKIDGVDYTAKLVVGQKSGESYYDHALTEIEKSNLINLTNGVKADVSDNEAAYPTYKDKRLLAILKTNSSKIVDENGEPLVVYHGTPLSRSQITPGRGWQKDGNYVQQEAPFNTFRGGEYSGLIFTSVDADKAQNIAEKRAMSIPDDEQGNEQWTEEGYVYDLFLNIRRPFDPADETALKEVLGTMGNEVPTLSFWGGEGNPVTPENALEMAKSERNSWLITETPVFLTKIKELGYDGLVGYDEWVRYVAAMHPNQIKSATDNTGAFSSEEDDIRYREASNGHELIGVHNLSEDSLRKAFELGGFPMPSIAVTKAEVGHTSFGDISLVFDKQSINPTDRRNKVYGEDAWTPVFPQTGYKLNSDKTSGIYRRANKVGSLPFFNPVSFHPENYEGFIDGLSAKGLVEHFKDDYGAKQFYLAENGNAVEKYEQHEVEKYPEKDVVLYKKVLDKIGLERLMDENYETLEESVKPLIEEHYGIDLDSVKPFRARIRISNTISHAADYAVNGNKRTDTDIEATKRKIDERVNSGKFKQWLEDLFAGVVEKQGIRNERDLFTPNGNHRKWEQLYDEVTLDNVVRAMQRQSEKGGNGLFGGSIFGAAQREYKSIDEIREAARERIKMLDETEANAAREAITSRLSAINIPTSREKSFGDSMDMVENITEAVSKSHTPKGIYKYLHDIYPGMTMDIANDIADIVKDIQRMSARYFEAKPRRAVGFNEVRLAVVPDGTDKALVSQLESRGIPVRYYEKGNDEQRRIIVAEAAEELDLRFRESAKAARVEKLRRSEPVEITGKEIEPSDDLKQYRKNALEYGKKLQGSYTNKDTGQTIQLQRGRRNGGINEVLQHDYKNVEHLQSIAAIPKIIENSIYIDNRKNIDREKNPDIVEYQYYVCGLNIGGTDYTVRSTVAVDKRGNRYYDHKLTNIEKGKLLDLVNEQAAKNDGFGTTPGTKPTTVKSYGKDNVLISILQTNGQGNIGNDIESTVNDMATELGINVRVAHNIDEVVNDGARTAIESGRNIKGWFEPSTGEIVVYLPNARNTEDAVRTVLHEGVAHYGLRQLVGEENFNTFLDNIYNNVSEEVKRKIEAMSQRHGWSTRVATEEYLASLAEDGNFEEAKKSGVWQKIKDFFIDLLTKAGVRLNHALTDDELRYILWRSYENLREPDGRRSILGEAADIALQIRLGVGNYSIQESGTSQVAEGADALEKTNRRFNEELEQQVEGTLPQGHIYQLGLPGETLQAAGFPNLPIELLSTRLAEKAKQRNHEFEISDVKNLVQAINSPIAVFQYGDKNKAQNVIVETERDGKKFVVGVHFNQGRRGIIVNDIRGIFPKNNAEWLNWINQGKLLYVDKEKIQALISKQRTNLAEVEYLDLDSVANIIENFENPQFSGEESLFYRDGKVPSAREEYDAALRTVAFTVREANLDYMASAKIMMDAINRQEGKTTEPWEDAYTAENHLSSRNSADHEFFTRDYWLPLMDEVRHLCSQMERQGASHGQALEEVDDYLRIKHGLERNEKMASRGVERARQELEQAEESYAEQEDKDGALAQRVERARRALSKAEKEQKERDFSGLFRLVVEKGLITPRGQDETASDFKRRATAAALREAALFEEEYDGTEALFDRVRAATGWTLRKAYESGLIGRGQYERVRSMYDYYVPLRGWTEDTAEEVYGYSGMEFSGPTAGRTLFHAKGRESIADSPLATIGLMAQDAIVRGNRNRVKQLLFNFARARQGNGLLEIREMWGRFDEATDCYEAFFPQIDENATQEERDRALAEYEEAIHSGASTPDGKPLYRRLRRSLDLPYRIDERHKPEHYITLYLNGEPAALMVNGDPRAAQAFNGKTRPDTASIGEHINRWLASAFTTYNPGFLFSNSSRDLQTALVKTFMSQDRHSLVETARYAALLPHALAGTGRYVFQNKATGPYGQYIEEFFRNGGETGYTVMQELKDFKKELNRSTKNSMRHSAAEGMRQMFEAYSRLNRVIENSYRVAGYIHARRQGHTVQESVAAAKDLTVNFNRKGAASSSRRLNNSRLQNAVASVSGFTRTNYLFFNVGMQSLWILFKSSTRNPRSMAKAAGVGALLFAQGLTAGLLNALLASLFGDDEDDRANYYNLTPWERRSNYILYLGDGRFAKIPISLENRVLYGLGEIAATAAARQGLHENKSAEVVRTLASVLPLDFTQSNWWVPDRYAPVAEVLFNRDWTGRPIANRTEWNEDDPEYQRAYSNVSPIYVQLSMLANSALGGDEVSRGNPDLGAWTNPAFIEHIVRGYTGGAGTTGAQTLTLLTSPFTGEEIRVRDIPVLNRFITDRADERNRWSALRNKFYAYRREAERTKHDLRGYGQEKGTSASYLHRWEELKDSPRGLRMAAYERRRKRLERLQKEAEEARGTASYAAKLERYMDYMRETVEAIEEAEGQGRRP